MARQGRKMDDQQLRLRRETSLKSMYFNRFMLIRYSLAVFFFQISSWLIFAGLNLPESVERPY